MMHLNVVKRSVLIGDTSRHVWTPKHIFIDDLLEINWLLEYFALFVVCDDRFNTP
jgi:hypothetical protein